MSNAVHIHCSKSSLNSSLDGRQEKKTHQENKEKKQEKRRFPLSPAEAQLKKDLKNMLEIRRLSWLLGS